MKRVLAIDYGDARTGLAFSDPTGLLAGDAFTVHEHREDRLLEAIRQEAAARGVTHVVMGYPKNMNGTEGPRAEKYAAFAGRLEQTLGLPVTLWDERRTTVEAHQILTQQGRRGKRRKNTVDAVAASLILEGYLTFLNRQDEKTAVFPKK